MHENEIFLPRLFHALNPSYGQWIPIRGLSWLVYTCVALSMVLPQSKELLELFVKRRKFLPSSSILSRREMTSC